MKLREGERAVILVRADAVVRFLRMYVELLREGVSPVHSARRANVRSAPATDWWID